jgi:hypothetical protein
VAVLTVGNTSFVLDLFRREKPVPFKSTLI